MPEVETRVESAAGAAPNVRAWYVVGVASWFLSFGFSGVIIPALVTQVLQAGGGSLALVQMSNQLPSMVFILFGGAVADRVDRRALLIALYLAGATITACLALGVEAERISLPLVIAYGLGLGALSAFVIPARDALLSEVWGANLMRAVGVLTLTQWGMQAVGNFATGLAKWVGFAPLIAIQASILLAGVPAFAQLPRRERAPAAQRPKVSFAELGSGIVEVARSRELRPVALLAVALGIFFIGPFLVVFPVIVRDVYHGGTGELGVFMGCFPLGVIVGSLGILSRGGLHRKGVAQLAALAVGALCMGTLGLGLPFPAALAANFAFGAGGAVFMTASRTIFQERANPATRGRVLSVYSLATMVSGGVLGSTVAGTLIVHVGPLQTCLFSAVAMGAIVSLSARLTPIASLR